VWGDAENAVSMTEAVRDALIATDDANADVYRGNASAYIAELREMDASIEERVAGIPEGDRKLVTAHDAFGYFAEAYGFEVAGTAIEGFTTEASDPAAGDIAELSDEIRDTGVPAIFPETTTNEALMERIANEAGVELAPPLYTDALGEEGSEGATYIEMMDYNATTIADALG
jgi:ABC-type Zn uptake system ZnuABC Zn-binding protein ZnuA